MNILRAERAIAARPATTCGLLDLLLKALCSQNRQTRPPWLTMAIYDRTCSYLRRRRCKEQRGKLAGGLSFVRILFNWDDGWTMRAPSLIIAPPTMTLFCKSTRREKLEQEPSPLVCLSHNAWLQNRICSEWSGIGAAKKIGFKSFFAKEFLLFNCLKCAVKQFFSNLIYWQHYL